MKGTKRTSDDQVRPSGVQKTDEHPPAAAPPAMDMQAVIQAAIAAAMGPLVSQMTSLQAEFLAIRQQGTADEDLDDVEMYGGDAEDCGFLELLG